MKVLVTDPMDVKALERIRAAGHQVDERNGLQGLELARALDGYQALLVRGATKVTAEVLGATTTLAIVVRAGTGLDNVDQPAADAKGIAVRNTPAANSVSVAELTIGLILALERHIAPAATDLKTGHWEKTRFAGRELSGRRLGLVGFGRIAREVATRARAFELEVWACDPLLPEWPRAFEWVRQSPIEELMAAADIVSVHVPLVPETRHLIGAAELARMPQDALLIHCARGGVVDETALQAALERGELRGAALDVFEREPPGDHPLLRLPNVLATPHLGASTSEAQRRAGDEAATILIEALAAH